jgi:hypothetical protein
MLKGYDIEKFVTHSFPKLASFWREDLEDIFLIDPYGNDLHELKTAICLCYSDCRRVLKAIRYFQLSWRIETRRRLTLKRTRGEIRQLLLCLRRLHIVDYNIVRDCVSEVCYKTNSI